MEQKLHILILEDDKNDVELIRAILNTDGLTSQLTHVDNAKDFSAALSQKKIDLILSDYQLPSFNGLDALAIRNQSCPNIPFIFVSGRMGEEFAIETLRKGATDYVLKDSLSRVPPVIKRALKDKNIAFENERHQEALRISEGKYRSLFEQSRDAIYITDAEGKFIDINQSALELFGYSKDEMMMMNVMDIHDIPTEAAILKSPTDQQNSLRDQEKILKRKDGSKLDCLITSTIRWSDDKRIIGYQGIIHNITERKDIEKAMFDAQKLESLGVLAGGIAHDFNNLLAVIQGNAELAAKAIAPSSPGSKFLEQIDKASQRSADLCKQLLAYAGKGKLLIQSLDINPLIQEISQLLQVSVSKNSKIKYSLLKNLPEIQGDSTQLRQVILNLVINSSEAIGDNPGTITLSTGTKRLTRNDLLETRLGAELPENEYVYFEVADTGCGMSSKTLDRIFDPFFTTKFTGRGLGLAAVLGIIRSHKGTFVVTSSEGCGTKFRIYFPLSGITSVARVSPSIVKNDWRGSGKVLVVDDEDSVRMMASQMIESFGFTVIQASDGDQALKIFKENSNDIVLVLLDMTMPQMTGEKVCRELYDFKPEAHILLMSGYTAEHANDLFVGKKLPGFIQKPFKLSLLKEKVKNLLEDVPKATLKV
jgi:two-component system cell cycle sensor histidine kinase/response regulator CckA